MSDIPVYKFAVRPDLVKSDISFLPTRATPLATGWDVRAAIKEPGGKLIVSPGSYVKIPLGFRGFCPPGWWFELKPRSSSFTKKFLHCLYGTIDEDYEGEAVFVARYKPEKDYDYIATLLTPRNLIIEFGEAIGQIIPIKRQEMIVESVSNEEYDRLCAERNAQRGAGGFGSTDEVKVTP